MFYSVLPPTGPEIPVVVEIPHAGLWVDPESMWSIAAPVRALASDADLYVDELYASAPAQGATVLVAHTSRYVCDLNRAEDDVDSQAVRHGKAPHAPHGLIWRTTTDEQAALFAPLSESELERRLQTIYRPYHQELVNLLHAKRERFGYAILLCGHSMPSRGRVGHTDPGRKRADIVPGSRVWTSACSAIIRVPEQLARDAGWTVAHDDPYRGGFTTAFYGRPTEHLHAVQVEISRGLYMDEHGLVRSRKGFARTQRFCEDLVVALGKIKPEPRGKS